MQHSCRAVRGKHASQETKTISIFHSIASFRDSADFVCGSVALKPSKLELPAQSITAYRQDEAAWADDLLGESSYTMASSGCLVTCIASAVSMETGTAITPGSLNAIFSENHVYDSEGNIQWAALEALEGFTADVGQEVSQGCR